MRWLLVLVFLCSIVSTGGCGSSDAPSLAECSGSVTFNGQPVANADVSFFVANAPLAIGSTDASGAFKIKTGKNNGAPIGKAKVSIFKSPQSEKPQASSSMNPEEMQKMQMAAMSQKKTPEKSPIPSRYADPKSSNLTVEVTTDPKKNVYDFQLVD